MGIYIENLFNYEIKWKSQNPKVATVSNDGIVTSVFWGDTKIEVSCLDTTKTIDVKVTGITESLLILVIIMLLIPVIIVVVTIYIYYRR